MAGDILTRMLLRLGTLCIAAAAMFHACSRPPHRSEKPEELANADAQWTFLDDLRSVAQQMLKICPNYAYTDQIRRAAIYGVLTGGVSCMINGKKTEISKWSTLRKLAKACRLPRGSLLSLGHRLCGRALPPPVLPCVPQLMS